MARLESNRWRFAVVVVAATALAAVLVGAGKVSAEETRTADHAAGADSLFAGIEQQGVALGSPRAPVTLVEYADLQCPYCAQWSRETLPVLVGQYVEAGKLRIVFPRPRVHRRRLRQGAANGHRRRPE
jgi:protein-disulfide isomerase